MVQYVGNVQSTQSGQVHGPGFNVKDDKGRIRLPAIFKTDAEAKAAAKEIAAALGKAIAVSSSP
jgi:hypothetical protein